MVETLQADVFEPLIGKMFQPAGSPLSLQLVTVERHGAAGSNTAQFSLILQGPPGTVVPEGLHQFTVDGQGFELYLVPILTASRDRQDYQISFN